MPRRPTVSRTINAIDVEYKYYDKLDMAVKTDTQRLFDYRMSEKMIIKNIETLYDNRKVLEVVKITTKHVTYRMDMNEFLTKAIATTD